LRDLQRILDPPSVQAMQKLTRTEPIVFAGFPAPSVREHAPPLGCEGTADAARYREGRDWRRLRRTGGSRHLCSDALLQFRSVKKECNQMGFAGIKSFTGMKE
jgi:hypothetical protein